MSSTIVQSLQPGTIQPTPGLSARLGQRRLPVLLTLVATVGSLAALVALLGVRHTTGGEIDGLIVGAIGLATGVFSLGLLATSGHHRVALGILVVLWVAVAFGGIGGYADHAKSITSASADQRARPPLAPLIFTGLGIVGAAALVVGGRRSDKPA